jgi:hypothetical protein
MKAIGSATTGSSEAILLGGLAMKKRWQAARKAAGKSIHEPGPNIVLGAEAHCSLEKFTAIRPTVCNPCRSPRASLSVRVPRQSASCSVDPSEEEEMDWSRVC